MIAHAPVKRTERLSREEAGAWVGLLRVRNALVRELDAELQARHNLPLASFEALLHLSWRPEHRMRLTVLGASVLLTQSGASRLVDRLERDGLVRREPSSSDGRGADVVLTESGLARLREADPTHLEGVRRLFLGHLTEDEARQLGRIWERVLPGATGYEVAGPER